MPLDRIYPKAISNIAVTGIGNFILVGIEIYNDYNPSNGTYSNVQYQDLYFGNTYAGLSTKSEYSNGIMIYFEMTNKSMTFSMSEGEYYDASNDLPYPVQSFASLVYTALGL